METIGRLRWYSLETGWLLQWLASEHTSRLFELFRLHQLSDVQIDPGSLLASFIPLTTFHANLHVNAAPLSPVCRNLKVSSRRPRRVVLG